MKSLRKISVAVALLAMLAIVSVCNLPKANAQDIPKREFRGAWLHIIGQGQYAKMTPQETQDYLRDRLNKLDSAGVNAVIWQVRHKPMPPTSATLSPGRGGSQGRRVKLPIPCGTRYSS